MSLPLLRLQIDAVDLKILKLLHKRRTLTEKIGRQKAKEGLDVIDPTREEELFARLLEENNNVFPEDSLRKIWEAIIQDGREAQEL